MGVIPQGGTYMKLTDGTATLGLTNSSSLTIKINESGDGVYYQYNFSEVDQPIEEAEINYIEDTEDVTGYYETDPIQASFTTTNGTIWFIGEFMRDNY